MRFGYARVSIYDQQRARTGGLRTHLHRQLLRRNRLGRNLRDLFTFVSDLEGDGIEVVSLTERWTPR